MTEAQRHDLLMGSRPGQMKSLDAHIDAYIEACLNDDEKAKTLVAWYQEKAGADNIDSTPTFVINGKKYSNMSFVEISGILDAAIE